MYEPSNMAALIKVLEHHGNSGDYLKIFDRENIISEGEVEIQVGYGSKEERKNPATGAPSEMVSLSLFQYNLLNGDLASVVYLFKDFNNAILALLEWENIVLEGLYCEIKLEDQLQRLVDEFEEFIFTNRLGKIYQGHLDEDLYK